MSGSAFKLRINMSLGQSTFVSLIYFLYFNDCADEIRTGISSTISFPSLNDSLATSKPTTSIPRTKIQADDDTSSWENKDVFVRALIVVACVSLIAVVYLVVRCLRLKHQTNKSRKYGLITSQEDRMELRPLGQEDDEEDLTVFDRTIVTSGKSHEQPELTRNGIKIKDKAP